MPGARDLPARQQTLRGAIAWSYHLLSPREQQRFRCLAAFVDGCSWEAAEMVCQAAGEPEGDILDGLLSLVDKSLLRQQASVEGEPRFWMLQTLREFGLEMLASTGETEVTRQAHAEYFLALAEEAEPYLQGAEQIHWLARLKQECENLRAALGFLRERARVQVGTQEGQAQAEQALRLCVALFWFWYIRGYAREGHAFLEQILAEHPTISPALRARGSQAAAELAWILEDFERAEVLCGEGLVLFREVGDMAGMASCLRLLGSNARTRDQYALARTQLEEAATLFQKVGDRRRQGQCSTELARIATEQGQYEQARILLEESLKLYQRLGDQQRLGWVSYLLARTLFVSQRDLTRSYRLAEQSLAHMRELGETWQVTIPLGLLGWMRLEQGDTVTARAMLEESLTILKETGLEGGDAVESRIVLARLSVLQGDLTMARRLYQESLALLPTDFDKGWIVVSLEGLAAVEARQGESGKAARLWGTAEALREAIGASMYSISRSEYEQAVAAVRARLGEEAFTAAWDQGRATPVERITEEVLKSMG